MTLHWATKYHWSWKYKIEGGFVQEREVSSSCPLTLRLNRRLKRQAKQNPQILHTLSAICTLQSHYFQFSFRFICWVATVYIGCLMAWYVGIIMCVAKRSLGEWVGWLQTHKWFYRREVNKNRGKVRGGCLECTWAGVIWRKGGGEWEGARGHSWFPLWWGMKRHQR